jgi:hypothetical protein
MATNKKTSTSCYRGTLKAETTLTDLAAQSSDHCG